MSICSSLLPVPSRAFGLIARRPDIALRPLHLLRLVNEKCYGTTNPARPARSDLSLPLFTTFVLPFGPFSYAVLNVLSPHILSRAHACCSNPVLKSLARWKSEGSAYDQYPILDLAPNPTRCPVDSEPITLSRNLS